MFKKLILSTVVLSTSLLAFNYELKPNKITDNVWCFLGDLNAPTVKNGGFMSNSCYIKTKNSYVLVDSGSNYLFAEQAYAIMSKIEKLPVSHVLVTHVHDDHWLGNSFYKKKFNSKILGPSIINKEHKVGQKTRMMNILPKDIMINTKVTKVDDEIVETRTLIVNDTKIEILPVGFKAHTSDDLLIFLPKEKVMFTGDVVMNGRVTSNRDGSLLGQIKALDKIDSMNWEHLIAGHGYDTSKNATKEIRKYFTLLKQRILQAVEDEVEVSNITKVVTLSEFKDVAMYDIFNSRNVFDAFGELEFYEEE